MEASTPSAAARLRNSARVMPASLGSPAGRTSGASMDLPSDFRRRPAGARGTAARARAARARARARTRRGPRRRGRAGAAAPRASSAGSGSRRASSASTSASAARGVARLGDRDRAVELDHRRAGERRELARRARRSAASRPGSESAATAIAACSTYGPRPRSASARSSAARPPRSAPASHSDAVLVGEQHELAAREARGRGARRGRASARAGRATSGSSGISSREHAAEPDRLGGEVDARPP